MAKVIFGNPGEMYVATLDGTPVPIVARLSVGSRANAATGVPDVISDMILVISANTQDVAGHQVSQTLGDAVYMWTFSDRPTTLTLTGMAFLSRPCNVKATDKTTGFQKLYEFYQTNKVSARHDAEPIQLTVTIAGKDFVSYLVGMTSDTSNGSLPVTRFTMSLVALPLLNGKVSR